MDYKVPLSGCDSTVVVRLEGGAAFRQARSDATAQPYTPVDVEGMWRAARNEQFAATAVEVELRPGIGELEVPVVVTHADE